MKIRFRQSGGLAGLTKVAQVDSEEVPDDEAGRLQAMVDEAFQQAVPPSRPALPDEEQYHIEVEVEARRETILVARSAIPGPLRPLIEYLEERADYERR